MNIVEKEKTIVLAGVSGMLGSKIAHALIQPGVRVKALIRQETNKSSLRELEEKGLELLTVSMDNHYGLSKACEGADCIVSALSGLGEVVIGVQKKLLDAAVAAGVPRFIPSDYSLDFTKLVPGKNRNLDLRRSFHVYLDQAPIRATSIFNGAFMDLVTGDMPLILYKMNRVLYWGNPSVPFDLTLTDNVADYTAFAALDENTPRVLHIAGERINARVVREIVSTLSGKNYKLFRPGSISTLNNLIGIAKFMAPASKDLYPAWQGMQYMRDMMEGRAADISLDNERYPVKWTSLQEYLAAKKFNSGISSTPASLA